MYIFVDQFVQIASRSRKSHQKCTTSIVKRATSIGFAPKKLNCYSLRGSKKSELFSILFSGFTMTAHLVGDLKYIRNFARTKYSTLYLIRRMHICANHTQQPNHYPNATRVAVFLEQFNKECSGHFLYFTHGLFRGIDDEFGEASSIHCTFPRLLAASAKTRVCTNSSYFLLHRAFMYNITYKVG